MSDMKRLNFIEIDELMEYEPDRFCKVQYNKILKEVNMIKSRTAMMAAHVKRIKGTLSFYIMQNVYVMIVIFEVLSILFLNILDLIIYI